MSICAIIQARMGSTRLPGKSMAELAGVPLAAHVIRRTKAAQMLGDGQIVLAVPDTPENAPLAELGLAEGVTVHRGSEDDVLSRFFWAAQRFPGRKVIVRITADDPFKDPALIDLACELFVIEWADQKKLDPPQYIHLGGPTWPIGLDVEVFTYAALEHAYRSAVRPEEREHVTAYIKREFGCWTLKDPMERGGAHKRWTIDTPEDLEFARKVYDELYPTKPLFGYDDILRAGF